jgi:hypothetical protein
LEFLQIINELSWGWDLNLNRKFLFVSYAPYAHGLNVIYAVFFSNSEQETSQLWLPVSAYEALSFGAFWTSE